MRNSFRIFGLLLHKNLVIRKRHWRFTMFAQIIVPIILFLLMQAVRDFNATAPSKLNNTYYPISDLKYFSRDVPLYYVPKTAYTEKMMGYVKQCLHYGDVKIVGFSSEDIMIDTYMEEQARMPNINVLAVIFDNHTNDTIKQFKYNIRHSLIIPNELFHDAISETIQVGPLAYSTYIPFVQVQLCLDKAFISNALSITKKPPVQMNEWLNTRLSIQRMPYPAYVRVDEGDVVVRRSISAMVVLTFAIPLCIEATYAAKEKFLGVTLLMEMHGVTVCQNLLSWLITGILVSILYILPIIALFKNSMSENVDPYLYRGDGFLFWLLMTLNVSHLICYGMHLAAYFSQPAFVATTISIVYIASVSIRQTLERGRSAAYIPYLGILFPSTQLHRLLDEVNAYELKMIGIQWSNVFISGNSDYNASGSTGCILIFSILGSILHFLLAIWANATFPGRYGVRKHPFYFLKYFKKKRVSFDEEVVEFDDDGVENEDFESVEPGVLTPGIQIRDLGKTYVTGLVRKSKVQALNGISVDFYEGQITVLLGHNGAGKTTLSSILTGLTSITIGKVYIHGKNIKHKLDIIRNDLGLCPQDNMTFSDLSVFEQLVFFGLLKGTYENKKQVEENVNALLTKIKLSEKRNSLPSQLSGGQKRKLSLGMALIGDANILILDEPTSGMDLETRRDAWDIILKMRGAKTIVISTHSMDEADALGDRVAILHEGRLKCYGTSTFLKKQYGEGYVDVALSTKPWYDPEMIVSKFSGKIKSIRVDPERIVLSVPHSESLPNSLDYIENKKTELGVTGVSVSLISMEQVYLKVLKNEESVTCSSELFLSSWKKVSGAKLTMQVILALLDKKITYFKKTHQTTILIILFPLVSVVLMSSSYSLPYEKTEILPLSLDLYKYPITMYSSYDDVLGKKYTILNHRHAATVKEVSGNLSVSNALMNYALENIVSYRNYLIASAEFNITEKTAGTICANAFYSGVAMHSIPITTNLLTNSLLRYFADDEFSIAISRQELPSTLASVKPILTEPEAVAMVMLFCSFFFPSVALFALHSLKETSTKVKQLQRMTGVTSISYWGTMFCLDLLLYFVSVLFIISALYVMDLILDVRMYRQNEILILILLLILFGINALLMIYLSSFLNISRNVILTLLSVGPLGGVLLQYLLHEVIKNFEDFNWLQHLQKRVFQFIPHVCFFHCGYAFYYVATQNARCRRIPERQLAIGCNSLEADICCGLECSNGTCSKPLPYFENFEKFINMEENVIYLALTPLLYLAVLLILEEKLVLRLSIRLRGVKLKKGAVDMDRQVRSEKQIVAVEISEIINQTDVRREHVEEPSVPQSESQSQESENVNLLLVYELSKCYGKIIAVREVSFRVKQRECFGLLGVNGAGKSTTFRMLTGEDFPNSGTIYLRQTGIQTDRKKYLAELGYCPQTDALIDTLNALDHLRLFARLRGIPSSNVESEVNKWIARLNLNSCMLQPSGTYSAGNKRRLNIAMALIGNPTLVLLDEPTTGVDPAARRSLWNILKACQASDQAIILTSHSMEECEALCNRLVIMVKGELVCIGPTEELKRRFGAGYNIVIRLNPSRSEEELQQIKDRVESTLPCEVRDESLASVSYHVNARGTTWTKMYKIMTDLKHEYTCIQDFSVLSATLEQLFIQFARGTERRLSQASQLPSFGIKR